MLPNKKLLKLSRNHGQKLKKTDAPLDDSMDDFIVTRPLRAERKEASSNSAFSSGVHDHQQSNVAKYKLNLTQSKSESELVESDETSTLMPSASEKNETHETFKFSSSEIPQLFENGYLQSVKKKLSPRLPQLQRRKLTEKRLTRRKAVDPSDLPLAIALSESLQSANEKARQLEEELLFTENLTEVISDLRKDEEQGTSTILSNALTMPAEVPLVPKTRRRAKAASKKEPVQYTLALRSHAERERLIADRAASVLSHEPDDPLKPPKVSFTHTRPVSDYLRKHSQNKRSLWQRASLHDAPNVDQSDVFYVGAFNSLISPPKKKSGYTNIMFHVSQLPGRNSSQVESFSNTQCILEELAFAAEGGFLDESNPSENVFASSSALSTAITKLTDDWSKLVNNPLLSDVTVRTKSIDISAHHLVFTVRFPSILNGLVNKDSNDGFILDWASYSASSALKVLRFIYTASYEHEENDAHHVYCIARRHGINELIDLLPNQYLSYAESSGEDVENSLLEVELETNNSPKSSKISFPSDDLLGLSDIEKTVRFSETSQEKMEEKRNENKEDFKSRTSSIPKFSEANQYVKPSILDIEKDANENLKKTPLKKVSSEIYEIGRTVTSAMDMEISSYTTTRRVPLSPDMFHETLSYSDEGSKSTEDIVDLTQETNSDRQSERSVSPLAGSCEMNENSFDKSDVSMVEYSFTSNLRNLPLQQNSQDSPLEKNCSNNSVASCFQANPPSLVHHSVSSWSCSGSEICNNFLRNCQSPISENVPLLEMKAVEAETTKPPDQYIDDEFPDELDPIFGQLHDVEPSPQRTTVSLAVPCSADGVVVDINTPEGPRQAKKRKMDVTPLPDYQTMETPLLKQELVKYGLKPLKRSNAVKLLHHIYEELHPLVTDSESSFQDTPERRTIVEQRRTHQLARMVPSPSKSLRDDSSYDDSESGHSQEDEENIIIMELDNEMPDSQADSPRQVVPLREKMKEFLKKRPDIHKLVLTYEPISFEYLFAEIRKEGISCKAQDLLDWLDEECITCRMKNRNRNRPANREANGNPEFSPPKKVAPAIPAQKARRGVAKKLIA